MAERKMCFLVSSHDGVRYQHLPFLPSVMFSCGRLRSGAVEAQNERTVQRVGSCIPVKAFVFLRPRISILVTSAGYLMPSNPFQRPKNTRALLRLPPILAAIDDPLIHLRIRLF